MIIERKSYIDKLIAKKDNGLIKIITGIRRCGKSYLLFNLYHSYLNSIGIADSNIIELALDDAINARYRNPIELDSYIRSLVSDKKQRFYVFIDEIQLVSNIQNPYLDSKNARIGFTDVLLGLMKLSNVDLYVTGSNSHMLSSDILTEFRDRGDEVRVYPLTYREFYNAYEGDKHSAWEEYHIYGGMPRILSLTAHDEKSKYLKNLFEMTYIKDVLERNRIYNNQGVLNDLLNTISSSIGSLTNPTRLANTFQSVSHIQISANTISNYLDYFIDAFILQKAYRYDIKGNRYIGTPLKYYFADIGLRNARLNFRQQEENHIMENIIYNELIAMGFDVDVGVVEYNSKDTYGKKTRTQLEIDFVANKGYRRFYIQSALNIGEESKRLQEINSLNRIADSFEKIVVVKDPIIKWYDEKGILYIGIEEFLLSELAILMQ